MSIRSYRPTLSRERLAYIRLQERCKALQSELETAHNATRDISREAERLKTPLTKVHLIQIARQYDQGRGSTYEFDQDTLLRMLREVRSTTV